ncbi:MAG: hypothetical protein RO257_16020 [Candidatus Kapabacteria bacterium]|jgi:hypothetical protein|nr:hypothetical protein [Candidatus Kapabacteria bacterium]
MNKYFKIFILLILNLIFFESQAIKSNDKYIKFNFTYEYPVVEKLTSNSIEFLKEISDSSGLGVYQLLQFRQNKHRFIKITNIYYDYIKKDTIDFYDYIKNDTLNILIRSTICFNRDSIPKPDLPDSINYNFQGSKKVRVVFINDSAEVNINWNLIDLELNPFWFGDY